MKSIKEVSRKAGPIPEKSSSDNIGGSSDEDGDDIE